MSSIIKLNVNKNYNTSLELYNKEDIIDKVLKENILPLLRDYLEITLEGNKVNVKGTIKLIDDTTDE